MCKEVLGLKTSDLDNASSRAGAVSSAVREWLAAQGYQVEEPLENGEPCWRIPVTEHLGLSVNAYFYDVLRQGGGDEEECYSIAITPVFLATNHFTGDEERTPDIVRVNRAGSFFSREPLIEALEKCRALAYEEEGKLARAEAALLPIRDAVAAEAQLLLTHVKEEDRLSSDVSDSKQTWFEAEYDQEAGTLTTYLRIEGASVDTIVRLASLFSEVTKAGE